MKNNIMFLSFILIASVAYGQAGLGLRGGVNLTTMTGLDGVSGDLMPKPGASFGLTTEFRLVDKERFALYLQPEFLFQQKGYRTEYRFRGDDIIGDINQDYFEIPLLVKMGIGSGKLRGTFSFGGYAALMVGLYTVVDGERDSQNRDNVESFDAGVILAGGLEYRIGPGALFGDIRYTQGLIDPYTYNNRTQLHMVPSITFGYVFRFGRGNDRKAKDADASSNVRPEPATQAPAPKPQPKPQEPAQPAPQAEAQEMRLVSAPRSNEPAAAASSEFSELIKINKHLDAVADVTSDKTTRTVNATEVLSRFSGPDALVIILQDGVQVDYESITKFLKVIEINHFRYKVTDRKLDANGLITEVRMHRVD